MEKSTHREASSTRHMNGAGKGNSNQEDVGSILLSASDLVSKELGSLLEDFSKSVPKATAQFLRKNWKPTALSATAGVAVGVGTYFLIHKFFMNGNRKGSFLH